MKEKDKKFNIVFIGTPDFGLPAFKNLIAHPDFAVKGVITQPDKKVGRKQILMPTPIKKEALLHDILVLQPDRLKNFEFPFSGLDFIIVIAYGQIIPKNILDLPKYGCINVHGSLLPKYRGAACISEAIKNGDAETGVTIMKMDEHLDTGPILTQAKIKIENTDTTGTLYEKISNLGAEILIPTLIKYAEGKIEPIKQDDSKSSYVGLIKKNDGEIDWTKSALEIERFIRAMDPWPGAFTFVKGKNIKISKAKIEKNNSKSHKVGEFFILNNELAVQCGNDVLIIKKIQPEGKNIMDGHSFINGYNQLLVGDNKN